MPYSRIVARDMPGGPPRSMHPFGETAENLTRDVWPAGAGTGAVEDHLVGQARLPGNGRPALSAGLPEVLLVRSQSCLQHVRPADPLKPGRDVPVVHIRVITALTADELEHVGVAALHTARHDAGRLAPQARRATVACLAGSRESPQAMVVNAQPRVSGIVPVARYGIDTQAVR
jgi:hypothetical protein